MSSEQGAWMDEVAGNQSVRRLLFVGKVEPITHAGVVCRTKARIGIQCRAAVRDWHSFIVESPPRRGFRKISCVGVSVVY